MNHSQRTLKRISLAAAAAIFAGGSASSDHHAAAPAPATQPAAAVESQTDAEAQGRSAPIVNIFGEFDGAGRPVTPASAEAGLQQHTAADEGYDADVATDPTGKWFVFSSTRHSEHPDIYLQRVGGASVIQLTSDPADDAQPVFSPDGKKIAFASTRGGNWDIYLMDADGKNIEQITHSLGQEMHPSFSPDGTRLVYCALAPRADQWEIWTIDLTSHTRKMIGQGLFPSWSPIKGTDRIAFQKARQRGSRWFSVWTVDLIDGEPRKLTEVAASTNAACVCPSWSPDGLRLAFTTILHPNRSDPAQKQQDIQDVWVISVDGAGRQRLTSGGNVNLSPFWSVDNRIFFISARGGQENIWSVQLDKSKATPAIGNAETKEIGK